MLRCGVMELINPNSSAVKRRCGPFALALAAVLWGTSACTSWCQSPEQERLAKMEATVRSQFPEVPQLGTAELAAWLKDKSREAPEILDVREPAEYAVSHLPGAIRVSPDAAAAEIVPKLKPGRAVVVYCSVGYRSSRLAQRLMKAGVAGVANLEGSIFAWANERRPLEKEGRPASTVHPYNAIFGRMLKPEYRAK